MPYGWTRRECASAVLLCVRCVYCGIVESVVSGSRRGELRGQLHAERLEARHGSRSHYWTVGMGARSDTCSTAGRMHPRTTTSTTILRTRTVTASTYSRSCSRCMNEPQIAPETATETGRNGDGTAQTGCRMQKVRSRMQDAGYGYGWIDKANAPLPVG